MAPRIHAIRGPNFTRRRAYTNQPIARRGGKTERILITQGGGMKPTMTLRDPGRDLPAEVRWRVQPGADSGPSRRQLEQAGLGGADARQRLAQLVRA
jgi:hypothetical protein